MFVIYVEKCYWGCTIPLTMENSNKKPPIVYLFGDLSTLVNRVYQKSLCRQGKKTSLKNTNQ